MNLHRRCVSLLIHIWLFVIMPASINAQNAQSDPSQHATWAIALHGGAGSLPKDLPAEVVARYRDGLRAALDRGIAILKSGGTSLDAVNATVNALEDNPLFNAGRGAVFNSAGYHELDASIMDGATLEGGGVAGVKQIKNPINAARLVMEDRYHVLMAGDDADTFAADRGCATVDQPYFYTERRWKQLIKTMSSMDLEPPTSPAYEVPSDQNLNDSGEADTGETVGCVALDSHGNLAAATSTGGRTAKRYGRVGDSPILGAGTYANNKTAAVSGTGIGEEFIRHSIAARVGMRMELAGESVEAACRNCLEEVLRPGDGGLIAVDRTGKIFLGTNTPAMSRAWAHSDGRLEIAIWESPLDTASGTGNEANSR
ncbi:isoaspartyl peptidase/L-asparaginase family protein [Roseiconus lacunae]|uniref:Isoaspartyl peptidase/L-asparaginase n=1 Tax=Roseiconus lacunae TaxID=2605694 RepID=A0ABT7PQN9_9BACT|nr:isoaspartyl peptidase/L-asparaginase [Roseiconus lacunae]MDM4018825.1 isoaspartyl peptidase/L-asparaginase [Roseiconus lacunae]WRQ50546.1 isoaspartyl peptidase/L-asparaginase [Stieleria sp. HD01]